MMPSGPAARTRRSEFRPLISTATPSPGAPSTADSGTHTSSSTTSAVGEAVMPILASGGPTDRPGEAVSTTNAVRRPPLVAAAGCVTAYTTSTSASGALVHHALAPFSTQPAAPSLPRAARTADVVIPRTSEPAPGSLMASPPTADPSTSDGRYAAAAVDDACRTSWLTHRLECAP